MTGDGPADVKLEDYQGWELWLIAQSGTFEARRPLPGGVSRSRVRSSVETIRNRSLAGLKKSLDKFAPNQAPVDAFAEPGRPWRSTVKLHRCTAVRTERVGREERLVIQEGSYQRRIDRGHSVYRVWSDEVADRYAALQRQIKELEDRAEALIMTCPVVTADVLRERGIDAAAAAAEAADA